jgi:hypothetical protein
MARSYKHNYEKLCKVGEGTYGVVCAYRWSLLLIAATDTAQDKARERKTGELVALKSIRRELQAEGMPVTSLRGE